MVGPDAANISVTLENDRRGSLEHAIHLLLHILHRNSPNVCLKFVELDLSIALDLL